MTEAELAAMIQPHITIDPSGCDLDLIEVRDEDGKVRRVLMSSKTFHLAVKAGGIALPDGTPIPNWDAIQLAFQNALIAKTGMCVLGHEYVNAGFPDLARMAKGARS